jgi:hypothetical protein
MNLITKTLATLAVIAIMFTIQAKAETPTKVPTNFAKVYIPDGFDDNDNVQIVGEGVFPNSCYRSAESSVRVDDATKTIHVSTEAFKYPGVCLQVILPYDRVVDVGLLKAGTYSVIRDTDGQTIGQVGIHETKSKEPDDFIYAPISQAYFKSKASSNRVLLSGIFPSRCMKLKEVRTQVQSDVLVILPIVEIDRSIPCTPVRHHFDTVANVGYMKPGRYLLHVRSMNGKAINNLVDVY